MLTNYQEDFLSYFTPDEDFVYFEDKEDLVQKAGYFLSHEQERQAIARSGYEKVAAGHTYRHRIREIFA